MINGNDQREGGFIMMVSDIGQDSGGSNMMVSENVSSRRG